MSTWTEYSGRAGDAAHEIGKAGEKTGKWMRRNLLPGTGPGITGKVRSFAGKKLVGGVRKEVRSFLGSGARRRRFFELEKGRRFGVGEAQGSKENPIVVNQPGKRLVTRTRAGEKIYEKKTSKYGHTRRRRRHEGSFIFRDYIDPETNKVVRSEEKQVRSGNNRMDDGPSWIGSDYGEYVRLKYPDYNPYTSEGALGDYYRNMLGDKGAERAGRRWKMEQRQQNRQAAYDAAMGYIAGESAANLIDAVMPNTGEE